MAARLLSALLIALLVASAHADTWQCALATDCYGCLSADPSCEWCPSSKQCASGTLTCSVSVYSFGDSDSCPCSDMSRDDCSSCVSGTDCAWCDYNGEKSCTTTTTCKGNWESGLCLDGTKLAKWLIAVIVVSAILVVLIPILIVVICCCCCVAGTAAAVNAGERSHLVQNSSSSATVIYAQPGYAPPPAAAPAPYYPQPTYQ